MKRFVGILLALLAWAAVFSVCAEMLRPDEVTTWEEARLFAPALDALWPEEPQPSYTQQTGFSGLFITPEEAWETLNAAYDQAGDAGTRQVLESWGILETAPEGSPVRHSPALNGAPVQVETIGFAGAGWGEDNTLIFVRAASGWQLTDCVMGETGFLHACGGRGLYLEMTNVGHGTGYYCRSVLIYNLLTRQTEAVYAAEAYETWFRDDLQSSFAVRCWGGACYTEDGVRILTQKTFSTGSPDGTEETVRAEKMQALVYACGEEGTLAKMP